VNRKYERSYGVGVKLSWDRPPARITILHRSEAKVNTVNYLFSTQRQPRAGEWIKEQKVNCRNQAIAQVCALYSPPSGSMSAVAILQQ
jgi:hypothetical protein